MRHMTLALVAVLLLLGACGGTAAPTDGGVAPPPAATDEPAPPAGGESQESAPETDVPIPTEISGTGSGGSGTFASHPCDLVTQADAEAAAGVSGLASTAIAIDPTSGICSWRLADGSVEVYAGVWDRDAATAQWEAMKYLADTGGEGFDVIDLGGDAIFIAQGAVLVVHKGETFVQMTILQPDLDAETIKNRILELGRVVLGRM